MRSGERGWGEGFAGEYPVSLLPRFEECVPLAPDSPLLNVPADAPRKQVLIIDGIRYSAAIGELAHSRLLRALGDVVKVNNDHPLLRSHIVTATMDAWTI